MAPALLIVGARHLTGARERAPYRKCSFFDIKRPGYGGFEVGKAHG
jgi:hypothetical protein